MPEFHTILTERLTLRQANGSDASTIFRYASDVDVVKYVGWPRHSKSADTEAYLNFSKTEWERSGVGPLLIVSNATNDVIGGTGLAMETATRATTGYVLAKEYWGQGFATEALRAVVKWAKALEIPELAAYCHADHLHSQKVLLKCGFRNEGPTTRCQRFPNLVTEKPVVVWEFRYVE